MSKIWFDYNFPCQSSLGFPTLSGWVRRVYHDYRGEKPYGRTLTLVPNKCGITRLQGS